MLENIREEMVHSVQRLAPGLENKMGRNKENKQSSGERWDLLV